SRRPAGSRCSTRSPPRLPPTPVDHPTPTRPRGCPAPPYAAGSTSETTPACSRPVACPPTEATPTTPPNTPTADPPPTPTSPPPADLTTGSVRSAGVSNNPSPDTWHGPAPAGTPTPANHPKASTNSPTPCHTHPAPPKPTTTTTCPPNWT